MPKIRCPGCRSVFDGEAIAGQSATCPTCRAAIRIPLPSPASSPGTSPAGPRPSVPPQPPVSPPASPAPSKVDDKAIAWKIVFGLGVLFVWARKFGCVSSTPAKASGDPQVQQFANDASNDLVVGIVVFALLAWGGFSLIRWLVRQANEKPATNSISRPHEAAAPPPPPPSGSSSWWLHLSGQVVGPLATGDVIDRLHRGECNRETSSCRAGETQWLPLASRPEFIHACSN